MPTPGCALAPALTFLWVIALTLGYTAALSSALVVLRLRTEEGSGRAELMLSAPVDRLRWAGGHLLIAALGTAAVLAAGGIGAGLSAARAVRRTTSPAGRRNRHRTGAAAPPD